MLTGDSYFMLVLQELWSDFNSM